MAANLWQSPSSSTPLPPDKLTSVRYLCALASVRRVRPVLRQWAEKNSVVSRERRTLLVASYITADNRAAAAEEGRRQQLQSSAAFHFRSARNILGEGKWDWSGGERGTGRKSAKGTRRPGNAREVNEPVLVGGRGEQRNWDSRGRAGIESEKWVEIKFRISGCGGLPAVACPFSALLFPTSLCFLGVFFFSAITRNHGLCVAIEKQGQRRGPVRPPPPP
ncbi:hypothetical protein HPB51_017405 [Rhipicephalus microplus]|uniref:Uncharacterized protein n=1 Tax=Rhipicephalus microplus TaxID=6941 RepID=A0A9J6DB78_RHIMP|nr:hypothetical protein HPB51_017405 [Rhipicephalus microplus]